MVNSVQKGVYMISSVFKGTKVNNAQLYYDESINDHCDSEYYYGEQLQSTESIVDNIIMITFVTVSLWTLIVSILFMVHATESEVVPNMTGNDLRTGTTELSQKGFNNVRISPIINDQDTSEWLICGQDKSPGMNMDKGLQFTIFIAEIC